METKKLRRSVTDSVIGGVSGGLGDYFDTDPVIFRILFVVLTITGGGGVFIYLLMWIFIPKALREFSQSKFQKEKEQQFSGDIPYEQEVRDENHSSTENSDAATPAKKFNSTQGSMIGGGILILAGIFFLADDFFPWFNWEYLWPVALIIAGLAIIKINYDNKKK